MYCDRNAIELGPERQLFLDDYIIDELFGVKRRPGQADKHPENPVLPPVEPWEDPYTHVFFTVMYDAKRLYRMWYQSWPGFIHNHDDGTYPLFNYATSTDGIHWQRPSLGLVEWKGSRDNNIFLPRFEGPHSVFEKPDEPDPQKRYRMLCLSPDRESWMLLYSPDGIHWPQNASEGTLLFPKIGILARDVATLIYDYRTSQWVMVCKLCRRVMDHPYGYARRCLGVTTSQDCRNWEYPQLVLVPDERDDARTAQRCARYADRLTTYHPDEVFCDFQQMVIWPYEGVYVGLISVFDASGMSPQANQDGLAHIELAVSRDLRHWERVADRDILIDIGSEGSFEQGMVLGISHQPVYLEHEIRVYYAGRSITHLGRAYWEPERRATPAGGVGLLTLRRDGFVALEVGMQGGYMLTKPFKFTGKSLYLNVEPGHRAHCHVAVEVLTPEGDPIPGLSREDCDPATEDTLLHRCTWKGGSDLSHIEGRVIRLKFHLHAAKLYSFWFET